MTTDRTRQIRKDAAAFRLVGAAVAVAALARPRRFHFGRREYVVPAQAVERLIRAAREAGFAVDSPFDAHGKVAKEG